MSFFREALFFHPESAAARPLVGCSACLLGEPVRYDGSHKLQAQFEQRLAPWLQLQAICPEVGIGLGVPRPTLMVIDGDFGQRVVHVDAPREDVTDALLDYADSYLHQIGRFWPLTAYIFKARSPSCGVGSTPVNPGTAGEYPGFGAFSGRFSSYADWLPLYEEAALASDEACAELLLQAFLCRDLLWQGADPDIDGMARHYSALLDTPLAAAGDDRTRLWKSVRDAIGSLGPERRRGLVSAWRA